MTVINFTELRKARRSKVLDTALIRFGDRSISCAVRNLSDTGAALDVGAQREIPDQFNLIVIPNKRTYACNVVWRKARCIGVSFR